MRFDCLTFVQFALVPEPATAAMLSFGMLFLAMVRRSVAGEAVRGAAPRDDYHPQAEGNV